MRISAKTDVGLIRNQNQDSYAAGELPGDISWAIVCDGMGGAAGGAVASTMAVRMISEKISSACRQNMTENMIRNILINSIENANSTIFDVSCSNPELRGMGTTAVAMIAVGGYAYIAHVGDSRAYKIKKDIITQITRDHSMVQQLVDRGEITPEQARNHPERNIITRAVGVDEKVNVEFDLVKFDEDEMILICSDGLCGYASDKQIIETIQNNDFYMCADKLIDLAGINGGGDNITVVITAY